MCIADCYENGIELLAIIAAGFLAALLARKWRYLPLAALIVGAPLFIIDFSYRATVFGGTIRGGIALYARNSDFWFAILGVYLVLLVFAATFFAIKRIVIQTLAGQMSVALKAIVVVIELGVPSIGLYLLGNHIRPDLFPLT
ncbi:MAG: hypothetical protein ABL996_06160 [Micropepsaceae bacterium]